MIPDTSLNISSFGEDEAGEAAFGPAGGTGSVTVTTSAGCTWNAASNQGWMTITGGASGSGAGTVTYSVAPYTGKPRNRNAIATIAGQTFSVQQSR